MLMEEFPNISLPDGQTEISTVFRINGELAVEKLSSYGVFPIDNHSFYIKNSGNNTMATVDIEKRVIYVHRGKIEKSKIKGHPMIMFKVGKSKPLKIGFFNRYHVEEVQDDTKVKTNPKAHYYELYPRGLASVPRPTVKKVQKEHFSSRLDKLEEMASKLLRKLDQPSVEVSEPKEEISFEEEQVEQNKEVQPKMTSDRINKLRSVLGKLSPDRAWNKIGLAKANKAKIFATITPKGDYVVGVDIGKRNPVWITNKDQIEALIDAVAWLKSNQEITNVVLASSKVSSADDDQFLF